MIKKLLPILLCIPLMYSCSNKDRKDKKDNKEKVKKEEVKESTDITKEDYDSMPAWKSGYIPYELEEDAYIKFTDYDGNEYPVDPWNISTSDSSLLIKTVRDVVDDIVFYTQYNLPNGLTSRPQDNEPDIFISSDGDIITFRVYYTYKNDYGVTKRASVYYYTDRDGKPYRDRHLIYYR